MIPTIFQILSAEVPPAIQFVSNLICFIGATFVIALIVASDFQSATTRLPLNTESKTV